jgi:hypothetical protein
VIDLVACRDFSILKQICLTMQTPREHAVHTADDIAVFTGKIVCEYGPVPITQLCPNVLVDEHHR